jgi:hypothetical protein
MKFSSQSTQVESPNYYISRLWIPLDLIIFFSETIFILNFIKKINAHKIKHQSNVRTFVLRS